MSKRTFASRTFAPRHFNSATWTGAGPLPTPVDYIYSRRFNLLGTSKARLSILGTDRTRISLIGSSQ